MIVETAANELFRVADLRDPEHAHVWLGTPVKLVKGAYVPKAKARDVLVRKAGCRIVARTA